MRTTERVLVVGLLALLLWLPLPIGSNTDWAAALFVLVVACLSAVWAGSLMMRRGPGPRPVSSRVWPMLALLVLIQAWVGAQWLGGISADVGATFDRLMLGCGYTLLFLLLVALFTSRRRLTALLVVLTVSGVLQAFFGALMVLSGTEWLMFQPKEYGRGNVTGTFVNRNHMACYLAMTLCCGIGLLMALRDGEPFRWHKLANLLIGPKLRIRLALVLMVIALVMTHSRMGNTAFFSSLLIIGLLFTLVNPQHRLRNGLLLASLLVIDLLIISQYFGLEQLRDRLVATQLEDKIVAGEVVRRENVDRDDIAIYALGQLEERPLAGFGAGTFETTFQRFPGSDVRANFDHAHNDYLQFLIEFGVVGTLLLGLFVMIALAYAVRAMAHHEALFQSGVGLGAAMGIVALLIHSWADFNLQIPANAATFITLCAIAVLANHDRITFSTTTERSGRRRRQR